jgi:UDP-N-acetylmuramoyl-tripeptide--D-alanyl-D-alanine ligase
VHNLRNATLAIAVARACGVPDADAARAIGAVSQIAMRSAIEEIGTLLVLNDAYNANPPSAREALATLDAVATDRLRVVVLGSMLELGTQSASLHEEIARRALASRANIVAGVGEFERVLRDIAAHDPRVLTSADAESLWPALSARLTPDAFILLKGSRGTRLERLIPKLREYAGLPPAEEGPTVH